MSITHKHFWLNCQLDDLKKKRESLANRLASVELKIVKLKERIEKLKP